MLGSGDVVCIGFETPQENDKKKPKNESVFSDKLLVSTRGVFHLWTLLTLASSQRTLRPWGWLIAARCLPSSIHIQKWPGWERLRRCSSRKVRDESSIKFLSRFVLGKSTAVVLWRHGGPVVDMYVILLRMYATELGLSSTPKTNQNEEADHQEKAHQPNKRQRRRSRPPERPVALWPCTPCTPCTPGVEYRKGKFAFAANGRSIANMDTDGFVKVDPVESVDREDPWTDPNTTWPMMPRAGFDREI